MLELWQAFPIRAESVSAGKGLDAALPNGIGIVQDFTIGWIVFFVIQSSLRTERLDASGGQLIDTLRVAIAIGDGDDRAPVTGIPVIPNGRLYRGI